MGLRPQIRERRMEKHMTQTEFAKQLSINQTQLSRYERGVNTPSVDILLRMEEILNCRLKNLYKLDNI